jgi:predicted nucleic acid-binding protein
MKPALPAGQAGGLVMADTCIWIASEKDPVIAAQLRDMTIRDRLVMCGIVYAEILRGLQEAAVLERRTKQFLALQWVETPPEVWRKTAEMASTQDRLGHPVPLTDVHVAALCLENELSLWTTDRHFDRFTTLHRFKP